MAFAGILPWLTRGELVICSLLLLPLLLRPLGRVRFGLLLRRTRVLLLALLLMYGFATPGAPLLPDWPLSPSVQGLEQGGLQAWRLLLVLGSLAIVLTHLGPSRLLAGIYALALPFQSVGMPAERFAVRLAQVLEQANRLGPMRLTPAGIEAAFEAVPLAAAHVEFELPAFGWRDGLFALGVLGMAGGLLW
jgi:hypothetical protein